VKTDSSGISEITPRRQAKKLDLNTSRTTRVGCCEGSGLVNCLFLELSFGCRCLSRFLIVFLSFFCRLVVLWLSCGCLVDVGSSLCATSTFASVLCQLNVRVASALWHRFAAALRVCGASVDAVAVR
jgi:hypothetical protein